MPGPLLVELLELRGVAFETRVVVAPMHQYAARRGFANDRQLMDKRLPLRRGQGGARHHGAVKVERRGCGTLGDLGF